MTPDADIIANANNLGHDPTLSVRINARGCSNRVTGYGNHFIELVLALLRLGADVRVYPDYCEPPLPPEFLQCLIEPWDYKAEVGIIVANPTQLRRIAEHTIGITTWETSRLPPNEFRRSVSAVDEIIVPCEDNIAVFKDLVPDIPCSYSPEGVDSEFYAPRPRDWNSGRLKIAMFGALNYRKGIDLGIQAFADLYADDPDVELHLATTHFDLPQFYHITEGVSNIHVHTFGWHTREAVRDFYYHMHALFAPYRGEGFYLPGAEFMSTGGILIAPNQMGAAAYHQPSTGYVIPAHRGPVRHWPPYHGAQAWDRYGEWLEYDEQDVRDTLQRFVEAPAEEKINKAELAAGQIGFYADWDRHAQFVMDHVIDAYRSKVAVA